jgi:hypothetical protein
MSTKLLDILTGVTIGEPQQFENMQLFPLFVKNGHQRGYRTLDEALELEALTVSEVSESGSVPSLRVENTGDLPVLMVIGEELIGAKQNRVLNTSILVPAQSKLDIPVSCLEQGRWSYRSQRFASSYTTSNLKLRKLQTQNVTQNLRAFHAFDANQGEVWGEVTRKVMSHDTSTNTAALHDVYEQTRSFVDDYMKAFTLPESAEGMLVLIDGMVVGGDLFDHHDTFKQLWGKLLRGYVLDALESRQRMMAGEPKKQSGTQEFLEAAKKAVEEIYESVGLGEDVRLSSEEVTGSSLLWENRAVHTSLFSAKV